MADFRNVRILVTIASGRLGTGVPDVLATRGATHVTAGSRDPARIGGPAEAGLRVDFDDRASLDAALRAGPMNVVSDAVERLPGRKPRALRHGFGVNRQAFTG